MLHAQYLGLLQKVIFCQNFPFRSGRRLAPIHPYLSLISGPASLPVQWSLLCNVRPCDTDLLLVVASCLDIPDLFGSALDRFLSPFL
jgi:hypothetical protein